MSNSQRHIHITRDGDQTLTFEREGGYVVFLDNVSGIFTFEIVASGVDLSIYGVYRGTGDTQYTLRTIQHHKAPDSVSNLLIKSILYDDSHFSYHGLVRIDQHCNGSHAYQKNQNLLLSPSATVDSRPDLEILSHEVFCTHGSSTGRPDDRTLYYLESRGISKTRSLRLYVDGFLDEVYAKVQQSRSPSSRRS